MNELVTARICGRKGKKKKSDFESEKKAAITVIITTEEYKSIDHFDANPNIKRWHYWTIHFSFIIWSEKTKKFFFKYFINSKHVYVLFVIYWRDAGDSWAGMCI